jgi:hypothetical protein
MKSASCPPTPAHSPSNRPPHTRSSTCLAAHVFPMCSDATSSLANLMLITVLRRSGLVLNARCQFGIPDCEQAPHDLGTAARIKGPKRGRSSETSGAAGALLVSASGGTGVAVWLEKESTVNGALVATGAESISVEAELVSSALDVGDGVMAEGVSTKMSS